MRSLLVLPLTLIAFLAATFAVSAPAQAATRGAMIGNGLSVAKAQIGDPYQYGAAGPNAFDCSGLLYYSFRKAGFVNFPRSSDSQYHFVRHISKDSLRPGDFVFFHSGGDVYHASIFVGWSNGHRVILHAPGSGKRVSKTSPWTTSWYAGTLRGM